VSITSASVTNLEAGFMRAGDCNDDGVVNTVDFSIMRNSFGKSTGQLGYDDRADFSGDSVVNAVDVAIHKSSFGQTSAPPVGPARR
jgi:hypothetical protein